MKVFLFAKSVAGNIFRTLFPLIPLTLFFLSSCEKNIDIEIPTETSLLVVEGRIESDKPPYVILTKSASYFETTRLSTFLNSFVHNAKVTVTVDNITTQLSELCTESLPEELRPVAADFLGISIDQLKSNNYCLYAVPIIDIFSGSFLKGTPGKTYKLTIESEGKSYVSITKIPDIVALDSTWFKLYGTDTAFGFAWAHLTDPDTLGNCYRWFAKRINKGAYGQVKDNNFVPPFGSSFEDKFFNGSSFDFGYERGNHPSDEGVEFPDEKPHFFKVGDTIVIKFCTNDQKVREFLEKYEAEIWNNENPFASPSAVPTNIEGGALGLWAGYGVSMDTIIAKP